MPAVSVAYERAVITAACNYMDFAENAHSAQKGHQAVYPLHAIPIFLHVT